MTSVPANNSFTKSHLILRDWNADLSGSEFKVLFFIFDRTAGWQKDCEYIKLRHFVEGIYTRAGDCIMSGVGLGVKTVRAAIEALEDRGYIEVCQSDKGRYFRILYKRGSNMLKVSNKEKTKQSGIKVSTKSGGVKSTTHKKKLFNSSLSKDNKEYRGSKNPTVNCLPGEDLTIKESIELANKKTHDAKMKKLNRARLSPTVSRSVRVWEEINRATYPERQATGLTGKEAGQIKSFIHKNHSDKFNVVDFLIFCVTHWGYVQDQSFRLNKQVSYPRYPSLSFVMGFKATFIDHYTKRAMIDKENSLSFKEQKIREHMYKRAVDRINAEAWYEDAYVNKNTEKLAKKDREIQIVRREVDRLHGEIAHVKRKSTHRLSREEIKARGRAHREKREEEIEINFKKPEVKIEDLEKSFNEIGEWDD